MEATAFPRVAAGGSSGALTPRLKLASDERLVAELRRGRTAAFEVLYDRHHRPILSFCRHMLGDREEAEDAVQHTFMAAYNDLVSSNKPVRVRAWLFTIARNRCYSALRARREQPSGDLGDAATEGLASQVQRRQDLRDLVGDLQRLPPDQRAALVLAELDALSHGEIAGVIGVPAEKVKALVFQARESLIATRAAREMDCSEIRRELATARGGALRRGPLRRHLRQCDGCRAFQKNVARQRRQLGLLLPVIPTVGLKKSVLAGTIGAGGGGAAAGGGGLFASTVLKGSLAKLAAGTALATVGAAGTVIAVRDIDGSNSRPHRAPPRMLAERPAAAMAAAASSGVARATLASTAGAQAGRSRPAHRAVGPHRAALRPPAHQEPSGTGHSLVTPPSAATPAAASAGHAGGSSHAGGLAHAPGAQKKLTTPKRPVSTGTGHGHADHAHAHTYGLVHAKAKSKGAIIGSHGNGNNGGGGGGGTGRGTGQAQGG